ncbi:INT5 protein, partial [Tichodroma muraria]|nr:INT5 protein [Tichodroma muraria]
PVPRSAQELAQEVKAFLSGLDPVQGTPLSPPAHARCALRLLRCLPPARHAALQHLRGLFDEQVCSHLLQREGSAPGPATKASPGAEVVQEVRRALAELVAANPRAWAPGVAAWASELMGQLSSKYAGRPGVPPAASLNELLQLWMSCPATRALLDIYSQCLAAMVGSCPDACVDALLDTSVQHSPHFDWVVAHVGSSFPGTIISRVLSCGLKDFCAHGGGDTAPGTAGDKRVPKIASVVGILGHLASRHAGSIKQELLRMFHESLGSSREHHKATVPFLLQLALMSPTLLATVSPELVDSLKPTVLNQLHQHFSAVPRDELDGVVGVVVHLLCHTSAGALRTLRFLLATAAPASVITAPGPALHEGVREACERLLQLLLLHLQKLVHGRSSPSLAECPARPVPFLEALRPHVRELCLDTLRLERKRCLWQHQLLALLAVHSAPHGAAEALFFLLALARTPEELALAPQLHAGLRAVLPDPLPAAELSRNTQTFLSLVLRCCRGSGPAIGAEAAKAVAAALVEAVCPEAAGAELAWPPEELARATVERDLRILRRFRQHPLLFPLLRLVAGGHPALCYCSVLLRGLLASLVAHWDACRASSTVASPWHLRASCALVALLAEGSLLPPVLGNMHELFPELAPFEVHLLLLSVWGYLRENSPLPQKFTFQPELGVFRRDFGRDGDVGKHLAVLHSVLHRNIHRLGLLAGRF